MRKLRRPLWNLRIAAISISSHSSQNGHHQRTNDSKRWCERGKGELLPTVGASVNKCNYFASQFGAFSENEKELPHDHLYNSWVCTERTLYVIQRHLLMSPSAGRCTQSICPNWNMNIFVKASCHCLFCYTIRKATLDSEQSSCLNFIRAWVYGSQHLDQGASNRHKYLPLLVPILRPSWARFGSDQLKAHTWNQLAGAYKWKQTN